jgi:hypothetical protein
MLEMNLNEILSSLYVVEPDPLRIWLGLQKAYPSGAFFSIIEDIGGGGSVSPEAMKKL